MEFVLRITNKNNKVMQCDILCALDVRSENFGLPDGVSAELINEGKDYKVLLNFMVMMPTMTMFISSTDNRQLFFYGRDICGQKWHIGPQLTKDGDPREKDDEGEYFPVWNPKKWNICDTHERLIWNPSNFVNLDIKRNQVFELRFVLLKSPSISDFLLHHINHSRLQP